MNPGIRLVRPCADYRSSFVEGLQSLTQASDRNDWVHLGDNADFAFPSKDFDGYLKTLLERETSPAATYVRNTVYWAVASNAVVGRITIRHELKGDFFLRYGGHVGYIVHPLWRKRGIASEMLRLLLLEDGARAIGKILITCDEHNVASEKTILKNGGVFEGLVDVASGRERKKRFWIDLG